MSSEYHQAREAAGIPADGTAQRWFDNGWSAGANPDVALHRGSEIARVRYALRRFGPGSDNRVGRRAFAKGVRAKLAHYRALGAIR